MGQPAYQPVEPAHTHGAAVAPVRRTWGWGGLVARIVLTLAGAAAMIVSLFMNWVRSTQATDISVRAMFQTSQVRNPNFVESIGFVMLALGLLAIVGLAPRTGWLTALAGALGIVVFVLLLVQMYRAPGNLTVSDLDVGAWIGVAGSLVALIGGFFGARTTAVVASGPTAVVP
jgi:hypothetical protein